MLALLHFVGSFVACETLPMVDTAHSLLVASVTQDEEDRTPSDDQIRRVIEEHPDDRADAMAYLLRYEAMVRQQEAQELATLAHLRPCLERLADWAGVDFQNWTDPVSFAQLRSALEQLEQHSDECMYTDRQLLMCLRLLTTKSSEMDHSTTLSWAEFGQCYHTCVNGMMTLQHFTASHPLRSRVRDRTMALLSLFEPPSTHLFLTKDQALLETDEKKTKKSPLLVWNKRRRRAFASVAAMSLLLAIAYYSGTWLGTSPSPMVKERSAPLLQETKATPSIGFSPVNPFVPQSPVQIATRKSTPSVQSFLETSSPDHLPISVEAMALPVLLGSSLTAFLLPMGQLSTAVVWGWGLFSLVRGVWKAVHKAFAV